MHYLLAILIALSFLRTSEASLDFDGSNDHVTGPNSSTLAITGDVTVAGWMYRQTTLSADALVGYDGGSESLANNILYELQIIANGNMRLDWEYSSGTNENNASSVPITTLPKSWVHYAAVRDTVSKTVTFYENGRQLGTAVS